MKKIFLIILIPAFFLSLINAQQDSILKGKKGTPILPEAGDFALGMSTDAFFNYFGNFFNQTTNNSLDLDDMPTIYGKYYLDDETAIRVSFLMDLDNDRINYYVRDDAAFFADPLSQKQAIDERHDVSTEINISASYLKYRGYGRLQGFYGATVMYGYERSYSEYTYGNPMTAMNPTPTTYFGYPGNARRLLDDDGISNTVMIGATCGIEYFFLPKISLGGDVMFGYSRTWQSQSETEYQEWNGSEVYEYVNPDSPGNTYNEVNTSKFGAFGSISIMFHF